jgi:hypothetical protein
MRPGLHVRLVEPVRFVEGPLDDLAGFQVA